MITRSGTTVRQHAVRFKKGADVRRVLEYDEDDWDFQNLNVNGNNAQSGDFSLALAKATRNGGILVNSPRNIPYSNGTISPVAEKTVMNESSYIDTTIPYDIEERKGGSWLWDAMLFTIVTLCCYCSAFLLYSLWGHTLYLALSALCIITFSYNVTYFDSTKPGILPPSPISPAIYKQMSGHSYHLTYLMSFMNGLIFLAVEPYIREIIVPPI